MKKRARISANKQAKKLLVASLAVTTVVGSVGGPVLPTAQAATTETIGDVVYELAPGGTHYIVKSVSPVSTADTITIEESIHNVPVTEIGAEAFSSSTVSKIHVNWTNITQVGVNAFSVAPTILLSQNGQVTPVAEAKTTVSVAHQIENEKMEYQWSTSATPDETLWGALTNDQELTTPAETGDYYLHVKATPVAKSGLAAVTKSSDVFKIDSSIKVINNVKYKLATDGSHYIVDSVVDKTLTNPIEVEDLIEGVPVTKIGASAFGAAKATSITFKNAELITEIGESAFAFTVATNAITLTEITRVPFQAFVYSKFNEIHLDSNKITEIGWNAFLYALATNDITLNEITKVPVSAFAYSKFSEIQLDGDKITEVDGLAFEGSAAKNAITLNQITKISDQAFYNSKFSQIHVDSDKITEIGLNAFLNAAATNAITLNQITKVPQMAFTGSKFSKINLNWTNITQVERNAFTVAPTISFSQNGQATPVAEAKTMVSVTHQIDNEKMEYQWSTSAIPDSSSWTTISNGTELTTPAATGDYYLHVKVTPVAKSNLAAVTKSSDVFKIGTTIAPPAETVINNVKYKLATDGSQYIVDSVVDKSLTNPIEVEDLIEGVPVTKIGASAFGTVRATSITFKNAELITEIGERAFAFTVATNTITLIEITKVPSSAFESSNFREIHVDSNKITEIGVNAFIHSAAANVIILNQITKIPNQTFAYSKFSGIHVDSDKITEIGEWAFQNAAATNAITLNQITKVPQMAFTGSKFSKINLNWTNITQVERNAFTVAPTISFSQNGQATPVAEAKTTVSVTHQIDNEKMEYQWSKSATPDETVWGALTNGQELTTPAATGDYYLHIKVTPIAKSNLAAVTKSSDVFKIGTTILSDLQIATNAVEKAEKDVLTETSSNVNQFIQDAKTTVTSLSSSAEKTALENRITVLEQIFAAHVAVEKAQSTLMRVDFNVAQSLVTGLPSGTEKTALQDMLDALDSLIIVPTPTPTPDPALQQAKTAVEEAEKDVLSATSLEVNQSIQDAKTAVSSLLSSAEKTALDNRITVVEQIFAARVAIEKAQSTLMRVDFNAAQSLVTGLPSGTEQTALQEMLDALDSLIIVPTPEPTPAPPAEDKPVLLVDRILANEAISAQQLADYVEQPVYAELLPLYLGEIKRVAAQVKVTDAHVEQAVFIINSLELAKRQMGSVELEALAAQLRTAAAIGYPIGDLNLQFAVMQAALRYMKNDAEIENAAQALAQLTGRSVSSILAQWDKLLFSGDVTSATTVGAETIHAEKAPIRSQRVASLNEVALTFTPLFVAVKKDEDVVSTILEALVHVKRYQARPTDANLQAAKSYIAAQLYDGAFKERLLQRLNIAIRELGTGDDGIPDLTYIAPTGQTAPPVVSPTLPLEEIGGTTGTDILEGKRLENGGYQWHLNNPALQAYTLKANGLTLQWTPNANMKTSNVEISWQPVEKNHYQLQVFADGKEVEIFEHALHITKKHSFAYVVRQDEEGYRALPYTYKEGRFHLRLTRPGIFYFTTAQRTFTDIANFVDVKVSIEELANRYIINGTAPMTFSPNAPITRAQFAAMVSRALDLKATGTNPFTDTMGKWYEADVQALYEAGIISGTGATSFDPEAPTTRQQAAAILERVIQYAGMDTNLEETHFDFVDAQQIAPYAQQAVSYLQQLGILKGKTNGKFDPASALTRAQLAKMLHGVLKHTGNL